MSKGVYCYIDNEKDRVVYVGKDIKINKNRRHRDHLNPSRYDDQPFNRILQSNPNRYNYYKLVELSSDFSDSDLIDLERFFIRVLNTYHYKNPNGFNFTEGGEGTTGYEPPEEIRKKISEVNNITGFYRVGKRRDNSCKQNFIWCYRFGIKNKRKQIRSTNLLELKEKVEARGLPWEILDEEKAKKSLEENEKTLEKIKNTPNGNKGKTRSLEQKQKISKSQNTTGFYRVYKYKDNACKQGFIWSYGYRNKSTRQTITSVNLLELQEKVEAQGLLWKIIDEEKAQKSLEENKKTLEKTNNTPHGNKGKLRSEEYKKKMSEIKNTTGFYRVSKSKNNTCKQGFSWRYEYSYKSTRKSIVSVNLLELKDKVEAQGLPWEVVDEEKAQKSLEENRR